MKIVKRMALALGLMLVGIAVMAPIGPLTGFFIGGDPKPAPETWPDTAGIDEITLRVPGTLPRSVIIWLIEYDNELYIVGRSSSTGVNMRGDASPVEMRLGDDTYPLEAVLMRSGWQPMMKAYVDKYEPDYPEIVAGFPAVSEAAGEISVFQLVRDTDS